MIDGFVVITHITKRYRSFFRLALDQNSASFCPNSSVFGYTIQQSSASRLPVFEGTREEAKNLVKGLEKNLRQQEARGALGNLVLQETIDSSGTKNLVFRVTCGVPTEDQKLATASYLTSIIEAAYPDHNGEKFELMMLKNGFASYLESSTQTVDGKEAVEYLQ